jgi:cysteine desulfurase
MGAALDIASQRMSKDAARLQGFCERFRDAVLGGVPGALLNGHPIERLPNNLSFSLPSIEPLALMRHLRQSASFSASSACATDKVQTSHVLLAMFGDTARARQAFRISPGRFTADEEGERIADLLIAAANELGRMAA